jgi:uncharacterized iron-regulated membrane protein
MPDNRSLQTRRVLVFIHRWTGLTIGLVLVVLGLTGSFAVYWREIDRFVRPELRVEASGGVRLSPDEILAIAKKAHPQRPKPWTLEPPYDDRSPFNAIYSRPEEKGLKYSTNLYVAINPYTGAIMSQWYWGETFVTWVYDIHAMLLAGLTGHHVVGVFGPILILVSLVGLYVWWPVGRFAKRQFLVKSSAGAARFELDLHRAGGFYSLLLMLMFGLTGYMFVFPSHLAALIRPFSPMSQPTPTSLHGGDETHGTSTSHDAHKSTDTRYPQSTPLPGVRPLTVGEAVDRALRIFPGSQLKRVYTPAGETGVYGIILRQPSETWHRTYPVTEAWLDQYDGHVLVTSDPTAHGRGERFLDAALPLHNGEAAGSAGRVIVFIAGFIPLLLFVTGLLQWLRRRRLRTAASPG